MAGKNYYEKKDWHDSTDYRHRLAVHGEDLVADYITNELGMKIVGRNVRYRPGELDIVALDKNCVCFIEVKTRTNLNYGYPSESVTLKKRHTLILLAKIYMQCHKQYESYYSRMDVAEVLVTDGVPHIHYIDNAFGE